MLPGLLSFHQRGRPPTAALSTETLTIESFSCALLDNSLDLVQAYPELTAPTSSLVPTTGLVRRRCKQMLTQVWETFIMLLPVFFLLTMIFGAGFYIGRVSKRE